MIRKLSIAILMIFASAAVPAQGPHSNTLTWAWSQGTGDPATGFHIWRSATTPVATTGTAYATVSSPATLTFVDTAVSSGQTWNYAVTAFNSSGDSAASNTVTCNTPFFQPAAATTLSAVAK